MNLSIPQSPNQEYFEIELPGLKLYNGLDRLQIKKITPFIHKKILSLASLEAESEKYIDLINELILNYDLKELYLDDLSYILYQIRLTSYNMVPITFRITCPYCNEVTKVTLDPASLEITEKDSFPTIALENFGEKTIRYRKIKDDYVIDKFLKEKGLNNEDPFYRTLVVDALVLDEWKPLEEVWDLMEKGEITVQDTLQIENALINNSYGVKQEITFECKHCNEEVTQAYELSLSDYFPPAIS